MEYVPLGKMQCSHLAHIERVTCKIQTCLPTPKSGVGKDCERKKVDSNIGIFESTNNRVYVDMV